MLLLPLLSLALVASAGPSNQRKKCCDAKCYKALDYGDSHNQGNAKADCKSYLRTTVTPCPKTITKTVTSTYNAAATSGSNAPRGELGIEARSDRFESFLEQRNNQPSCPKTSKSSKLPKYASKSCSLSDYSAACSCLLGYGATTTTLPQSTITRTITKTVTPCIPSSTVVTTTETSTETDTTTFTETKPPTTLPDATVTPAPTTTTVTETTVVATTTTTDSATSTLTATTTTTDTITRTVTVTTTTTTTSTINQRRDLTLEARANPPSTTCSTITRTSTEKSTITATITSTTSTTPTLDPTTITIGTPLVTSTVTESSTATEATTTTVTENTTVTTGTSTTVSTTTTVTQTVEATTTTTPSLRTCDAPGSNIYYCSGGTSCVCYQGVDGKGYCADPSASCGRTCTSNNDCQPRGACLASSSTGCGGTSTCTVARDQQTCGNPNNVRRMFGTRSVAGQRRRRPEDVKPVKSR